MKRVLITFSFAAGLGAGLAAEQTKPTSGTPLEPGAVGHPAFMSPHASPIAFSAGRVFVANTPADTVDVIDARTRSLVARVNVGINPVSVAVRPDGREVWVANHISDSVSVIDADPASPTHLQVIATVQDFDAATKATRFDEPVGVAFAGNEKAYVALSSENQIAVIDMRRRVVIKRLDIPAQDPRAIVVRGDRLYVIPFESGNQTQLSGGGRGMKLDGDRVTFDAWAHSIATNNVLSIGHVTDIVKHPKVPDRDLFVFDTATDTLIETVNTLGTLLYGLAVDSRGRVFIAQTDARNEVNGRAGTKKHGLAEMENRAFLNRITRVSFKDGRAEKPEFIDLEPLPPQHPEKGMALATPFAIEVSGDDATLVVSAAGSDKLFTVDVSSGKVLGRVEVGAVPEGIALECADDGKPSRAWVLNAAANTVSVVDLSSANRPQVLDTILLQDPTHPLVKRGRIAFETARASTTETFSCASCHPNGHTDQLLWVLQTPVVTGGNQIMPRSTMPVRGLRDTEPYHWDGIPGDPYGGIHSASIRRKVAPNSKVGVPETSTRFLIDAGLASTMARVGDKTVNDEGKAGALTAAERDAMARFILDIPYPPAQRRAYDNVVSSRARDGFRLFHIDGDNDPSKRKPNVCGDCHRMPFLVSTDTPGTGMDAPTWRGAYDRWLILPQGRLNIIDFDFYERMAKRGAPEREVWQMSWAGRERFNPVWDMVLEGSTGFSGAFARQVTLNRESGNAALTLDLLNALEQSAGEGAILLQGEGIFLRDGRATPVALQFETRGKAGRYAMRDGRRESFTREKLLALSAEGRFVGTFTARLGAKVDLEHPQPALWTLGPIQKQSGRQEFPILFAGNRTMKISGRHLRKGAHLIVDGRRVPGKVKMEAGETIAIELTSLPPIGMHLLQVQNPGGLFSNDFIFHVADNAAAAEALTRQFDTHHSDLPDLLAAAIARGDLEATKRHLRQGADVNQRRREGGATPLSTAALHGRLEIARHLIGQGASVTVTNRDGNTPLHAAAFLCRAEMVKLLLENGASISQRNNRQETPLDVVSGRWSNDLANFYTFLEATSDLDMDLTRLQEERPRMARLLTQHAGNP
jgi:YVTN family beta-propeller protein